MTIATLLGELSSGRALDVGKTTRRLTEAWEAFEQMADAVAERSVSSYAIQLNANTITTNTVMTAMVSTMIDHSS